MDDREVVARCIRRDAEAWSALVARYGGFIYGRVRSYLDDAGGSAGPADVQDVFQDVFARLLDRDARALRLWHGRCSLAAWLGFVVRTECRRWLTRARRAGAVDFDLVENVLGEAPPDPAPDEPSLRQRLSILLADLPPRERLLLRLRFQQGLKVKEIARVLNMPANSVGPALTRAVRRLLEKSRESRDF